MAPSCMRELPHVLGSGAPAISRPCDPDVAWLGPRPKVSKEPNVGTTGVSAIPVVENHQRPQESVRYLTNGLSPRLPTRDRCLRHSEVSRHLLTGHLQVVAQECHLGRSQAARLSYDNLSHGPMQPQWGTDGHAFGAATPTGQHGRIFDRDCQPALETIPMRACRGLHRATALHAGRRPLASFLCHLHDFVLIPHRLRHAVTTTVQVSPRNVTTAYTPDFLTR